jgi:hypothetical protein
MNIFKILPLFFIVSSVYGQNFSSVCQGSDSSNWTDCYGRLVNSNYDYIGSFFNGKKHGYGEMLIKHTKFNGDKYLGEWKEDDFNGQGTYQHASGNKDIGFWKKSNLNGLAIKYDSNGKIIQSGIYKDHLLISSKFVDSNVFNRISSTKVAIIFSKLHATILACQGNDMKLWDNCFGEYPTKEVLKTIRESDKLTTIYYYGEFKNGVLNGEGVSSLGKSKYVGQFKNGLRHGQGIQYDYDGTIDKSGIFEKEQLIKSQIINPQIFSRLDPSKTQPAPPPGDWFPVPYNLERAISIEFPESITCKPTEGPSSYIKALIGLDRKYSVQTLSQIDGKPTDVVVTNIDKNITLRWVRGAKTCQALIDRELKRVDSIKAEKLKEADKFK